MYLTSIISLSLLASISTTAVTATIRNVVGNAPLYSGPEMFNVCTKISKQLGNFMLKYQGNAKITNRKFAVIVGTGSCNPITRMHMRMFFLAKQHLEQQHGFVVLGSLLSPAHPSSVRERYRNNITEVIPAPHRLAIAQLLVQESKWLSVDPWEITRKRSMDYLASLEHTAEMLKEKIPNSEIKVIYLCKGNMIPKISPQALKSGNFGCVVVSRAPESEQLLASLSSKWNGLIWVCEDKAILDTSLDVVSGRSIRKHIKKGLPVSNLIGDTVEAYINENRIGPKMIGEEPWGDDEKKLPKFGIRPVYNPLRTLSRGLNSISSSYSNKNTSIESASNSPTPNGVYSRVASNLASVFEDSTFIDDDDVSALSP
jgi:nicotinamide mononucleotide adenylyltransferase